MLSFSELYCDYCVEFTDSPIMVHHRMALAIISTVVNRNVYFQEGYRSTYPNLWMIVIAPSSFYRKSYSVGIAENIIRDLAPELILPKEFTAEKLLEMLEVQSKGLLVFYEFKTFMGLMNRTYMDGAQSLLTELYDCPSLYNKKTVAKTIEVKEPFLNIVSATTMDWLVSSIKETDMAGGFLPRFLIVSPSSKDSSMAWQPRSDPKKYGKIMQALRLIQEIRGEMTFTKDSVDYYTDWYKDFESNCNRLPSNLSPFYVRLAGYCKKIAMLLAIDRRMEKEINKQDMIDACIITESHAQEITKIVTKDLWFNKDERDRNKVETTIKTAYPRGVTKSQILQRTHLLKKFLDPILDSLIEQEQIGISNSENNGHGPKKRLEYVWREEQKEGV